MANWSTQKSVLLRELVTLFSAYITQLGVTISPCCSSGYNSVGLTHQELYMYYRSGIFHIARKF